MTSNAATTRLRDLDPLLGVLPREVLGYWTEQIDQPLFVYLIQADRRGPVKIGQAINPVKRLAELQCGNAGELGISGLVLATVQTEKTFHEMFMRGHIRGEWFGFQDDILTYAAAVARRQIDAHKAGATAYEAATLSETLVYEIIREGSA